jgi:leucyl-tRNA synthetase
MKTRTAIETALFGVWNDFRWYFRRVEKPNGKILREALNIWVRLLTPFIPHLCEEVWSMMHSNSFASLAPWPICDEKKIDTNSEHLERLIKDVLEDTLNIVKATHISPQKIVFYVASEWKWQIYLKALKLAESGPVKTGQLMASVMDDSSFKRRAKQITKYIKKIVEETIKTHEIVLKTRFKAGQLNEFQILKEASNFFKKEFNATIEVYLEEDIRKYDPNRRALLAKPYKPAIYIE